MARLVSRNKFPPGEFQVLHPEAGMKAPFKGSFMECATWEARFRQQNPALVEKHGWSLDGRDIEDWIDEHNALRLLASGHVSFVDVGVAHPSLNAASTLEGGDPAQKKTGWQSVAGASKRLASGAALLVDWLGSDKKPVARPLAEKRAGVCAARIGDDGKVKPCPQNSHDALGSFFTTAASEQIATLLSLKHDLTLATPLDDSLGICKACLCPMKLKVWCPPDLIEARMLAGTYERLDPLCWIRKEREAKAAA